MTVPGAVCVVLRHDDVWSETSSLRKQPGSVSREHVPSLLRIACVRTISKFAADRAKRSEKRHSINMLPISIICAYD
jgi:hypothetical protein